jgi:hypothetical protein
MGRIFYLLFLFKIQVRDCVMQRVYELLRRWWLEGIEEEIPEKSKEKLFRKIKKRLNPRVEQ